MTQPNQSNATSTKLVKVLKKTIKTVMTKQGVNPSTRKGNKELDILVKQLAKQPFPSEEEAKTAAEKLGRSLVELSQKNGKTYLDKGVVKNFSLLGISSILASSSPTEETHTITKVSVTPVEAVEETTDKVPETAAEIISETVETVIEAVEETTDKVPETAAEIISETVETVIEAVEETTDKVPETTTEIISETVETVIEAVEETIDEVPETTTKIISETVETVIEAVEGLKERLTEDIKLAMKARDKIRLETVRSIKKVVLEKEVEVRPKGQEKLTPEQELEVLSQQAKQRRDSIEQYRQGGRDDLADKEALELAIIETYLPAQLSDEEIGGIIDQIIASSGATSPKDMGKVMGPVMKELKGKADGKKVQEMVKEKLS
ncbi:GatB/YqeY domain-containing protein [Crocosphaera sp. UHCC 0190]|uniref:GatB/YqeY domain-containing protein n=1 Tax=Crocosphaera sp. UHCC 0190 TaxID=3110246 RepID=UPI002B215120|nr:GatB/YqeY domain-containing protein [Crocosphaera sp. UHCC 0190]MEA5508428.1 GatB/YqeY domain-containing protein [Crocosphaera sp. UHCC 0190]